jgi:hypothetical protein
MTGTVHTVGSSMVFLCCLVQPLCSGIRASDSDFVHGELAVSLSKQLRVHFIQCLVTLNVLPGVLLCCFNMHIWQRDEFRPIIYIFCAVWKSIHRPQLSNLYSFLALQGMPAVSWKKFVFCGFYNVMSHCKSEDLEEPSGAGKVSFTLFYSLHRKSVHIAPEYPENTYSFG